MNNNNLKAVNKFLITDVRVLKTEAGFQVNLQWKAAVVHLTSEWYWVWIFCKDEVILKQAVSALGDTGQVQINEVDTSAVCSIGLSDEEAEFDSDKCEKVPLCFASYEGLKGNCEGQTLHLSFAGPTFRLTQGRAEILPLGIQENSPEYSVYFGGGERALILPFYAENYASDGGVKVSITPYMNEISAGPKSESGWFLLKPTEILSCHVSEEAKNIQIEASFTCAYDSEAWRKEKILARAVLYATDGAVWKSEWKELTRENDDVHRMSWQVNEIPWCDIVNQCSLLVQLSHENCCGALKTAFEAVPLMAPQNVRVEADQAGIDVYWDYCGDKTAVFAVSDGVDTWLTGKRHLHIAGEGQDMLDKKITVRMQTGETRGPASVSEAAFLPGYYPEEDNAVTYCSSFREESEVVIPGLEGLFAGPLQEAVSQGPLSFETNGALEIRKQKLSAEDFNSFLNLAIEKGLTVPGFYRLRALIARQCTSAADDLLYYYSGLLAEDRTSLLIPGMSLCVTPSAYMWQTSMEADDNAGMIQGAQKRFSILLREKGKTPCLSVNAYLSEQILAWGMKTEQQIVYGGEMDLLDQRMSKPYWALWYPRSFQDSSQEPTDFPSENPVLLASDTIDQMETAVKSLNQNPTKAIGIPHLTVRGRSVLVPEITVWFNGHPLSVPLGTKLGDILEQYCPGREHFFDSSRIRMMRGTGLGYCPVHVKWFGRDLLECFPLMAGDRITTE